MAEDLWPDGNGTLLSAKPPPSIFSRLSLPKYHSRLTTKFRDWSSAAAHCGQDSTEAWLPMNLWRNQWSAVTDYRRRIPQKIK